MKDLTGFCIPDLEWRKLIFENIGNDVWVSSSGYEIEKFGDDLYYTSFNHSDIKRFDNFDEAKSACQQHFENQVLSLLREIPKPENDKPGL